MILIRWNVKCDINQVKCDINQVKCDINQVKCDINQVKCDINQVKCDINQVKCCDINQVKCDINQVKCDINQVKCDINQVKCDINQVKCDINQVKCDINVILFRCLAKCYPTFPIKVGSKKIFFIQIITLWYNSSMTPELYHILLTNVILLSSHKDVTRIFSKIIFSGTVRVSSHKISIWPDMPSEPEALLGFKFRTNEIISSLLIDIWSILFTTGPIVCKNVQQKRPHYGRCITVKF